MAQQKEIDQGKEILQGTSRLPDDDDPPDIVAHKLVEKILRRRVNWANEAISPLAARSRQNATSTR